MDKVFDELLWETAMIHDALELGMHYYDEWVQFMRGSPYVSCYAHIRRHLVHNDWVIMQAVCYTESANDARDAISTFNHN